MSRTRQRSLVVLLAVLLSLGGTLAASSQPQTESAVGRCCVGW